MPILSGDDAKILSKFLTVVRDSCSPCPIMESQLAKL